MEWGSETAPLKLVSLRLTVSAPDTWLGEQVDPVRKLTREHDQQKRAALLLLQQIESVEKAGAAELKERLGE